MGSVGVVIIEPDSKLGSHRTRQMSVAGELEILGVGRNITEACAATGGASPVHVVVANLDNWAPHWVESWALLHAVLPGARVVGLIEVAEDRTLMWALVAGVVGLQPAGVDFGILRVAIVRAAKGVSDWDPQLAVRAKNALFDYLNIDRVAGRTILPAQLVSQVSPSHYQQRLTEGEREVLALLGYGLSNQLIAGRLFLSERTVRNRVSSILRKLGLANRTQAALKAIELGLAGSTVWPPD